MDAAGDRALAHVRALAERNRARDVERIERALPGAEALLAALPGAAPLTLNFHPDRLLADGRPVAEALLEEGVYRSQFETRISNGGLTACPGGDRDVWERALFGGAYDEAPASARPRYGGLNLMRNLNGACAGFGSCHLRLRAAATARGTFVLGDSSAGPAGVAVSDSFAPVLAPLLERIAADGVALGRPADVRAFAHGVLAGDAAAGRGLFAPALTHDLYDYVEAQVHGVVSLAEDADALVLDPAFAGTPTAERLLAAAERWGFAVEWHPGLALALADVPEEAPPVGDGEPLLWQQFCAGGRARRLAERVTGTRLDAASIGEAAVSAVREPGRWSDWAPPAEVLQQLKYLWRMVVAHGRPISSAR